MRSWFRNLFRCNQIFGGDDLPLAVASHPRICPNKPSSQRITAAPLPRLVSLCHGRVAVEPDLDLICVVRDKILWRLTSIGNHLSFVIGATLGSDTDKVVREGALDDA